MDLIEQYRQLHEAGYMSGSALAPFVKDIQRWINRTHSRYVLDYGCGNAAIHVQPLWPGVEVTLYDPAIPEFNNRPTTTFDGVICTDVLEHLPEEDVPAAFDTLFEYATKFLFVSVCCRAANLKLPDGTNAHKTIQPENWWRHQLLAARRRNGFSIFHDLRFTP